MADGIGKIAAALRKIIADTNVAYGGSYIPRGNNIKDTFGVQRVIGPGFNDAPDDIGTLRNIPMKTNKPIPKGMSEWEEFPPYPIRDSEPDAFGSQWRRLYIPKTDLQAEIDGVGSTRVPKGQVPSKQEGKYFNPAAENMEALPVSHGNWLDPYRDASSMYWEGGKPRSRMNYRQEELAELAKQRPWVTGSEVIKDILWGALKRLPKLGN